MLVSLIYVENKFEICEDRTDNPCSEEQEQEDHLLEINVESLDLNQTWNKSFR